MPDRYLGRTIGKYQVIRLLGTGAFSWVYEAVDQDLEIPVALKILRPEFAGREVEETRFRREAATAARLRHPNIVTVRDVGQVDGAAFVAMDLHPVTLGRRLALVGRLPETECVRIGIGVAAALAVAHASQVVHRDIKPDNILLDQNGDAVVADFGLARALAGASTGETTQVQGTPHYFSPEQARGQTLDGRSDLYSLGITLYRAATGRLPFEGDDWYAVARQQIETVPVAPRTLAPDLTPAFDALVMRLLAKDPVERVANALALVDALAALPTAPEHSNGLPRLGASTIDAFRITSPPRGRRPLPLLILLGTVALVLWITWRERGWMTTSGARAADSLPAASRPPAPLAEGADTVRGAPVRGAPVRGAPVPSAPIAPQSDLPSRAAATRSRRTVRLELSTSDSAQLYVDNRMVGSGRWSGEVPLAPRLAVRAVVADAPVSCRTALRDTVLTSLRAGQRVTLDLPVRGCAVVRFRVEPRDARVAFLSLDGGRSLDIRADSAVSISLPTGRYLLRISAPRCITFSDTILVRRSDNDSPVPRKLFCN